MDDDDWGLSFEELDSLERNAAAQLASRNKSSSSTAPIRSDSDSPQRRPPHWNKPSSLPGTIAPILLDSPKKQRLDADVICLSSPQNNVGGANKICMSPPKNTSGVPQSLSSPQKNVGTVNKILSSPAKKTGRELKVKLFRDEPGRIAVESPYHPDLVAVLRSVSGKRWDQQRKVWTYPESELNEVVRAMRSLPRIQILIVADPSLEVHDDELLVESRAEPSSPQGSHDWEGKKSQSPKQLRSLEDGFKSSMQSAMSQPSQDGGSSKRPLKECTVKLCLHNSGKIAARFEYDSDLIASFRKIPKAAWDAKERLWMFPFSSLVESEKILSNVSSRSVKVEPLVPLVKRALEATAALPDLQERYDCIPNELKKTLMDFQVDGVRFSLQHGGRALIADEMGLGKTLQALAVVSCLKEDWPVLIVVPSSLRLNWATMLQKWLHIDPGHITIVMSQGGSSHEGFKIVRTAGNGKQKLCLDGLFNIVSYDVLTKLEDLIYLSDFQIVIADESHYMKNPSAKRTNACIPILQKAKYALLLTGTPALSRPIEMFKQLEALQPSVYKRIEEYGNRYCLGGFFGVWQGASNHDELHALVKSTVMIRRLKKDVLKQLPKKRREQVFISLDDKGAKKLHELIKQLETAKNEHRVAIARQNTEDASKQNFAERQLLSQFIGTCGTVLCALSTSLEALFSSITLVEGTPGNSSVQIYSESAEAKLPSVQDYLTTMIEASCKFLVFAHHQCMLDGIEELLQKKKVKFIRIDGKTPSSFRQDLVTRFQTQSDVTVAVLGIRAAGVGLTLTAASTVIFAEMSWTPGDLVQAEDRVHRIGQEFAVNIYYLHAKGSIDDIIWDAVQHKLENLGQVLDGDGESSMKVASASMDHGGPSLVQETLDPYLQPAVKPSAASSGPPAVRAYVAEIMTPSQAKATIEAFLRPFEMGKDGSSAQRSPTHRVEDSAEPRISESSDSHRGLDSYSAKRKGTNHHGGRCSGTGQEPISIEDDDDDIAEVGEFGSNLVTDRLMQYAPQRKSRRLS